MSDTDGGIPPEIKKYRHIVAETIEDYLRSKNGYLHKMIKYHLGLDKRGDGESLMGKKIRSSLVLFTVEALGGDPVNAVPAAVSLELIHNFSLVHDDIQDNDQTRRGRETVQKKWGPEQAINVGDGLKDLSLLSLIDLSPYQDPEITLKALRALTEYSLRMIEGQVQDLHQTYQERIDINTYLRMIRDKTCALLEGSFHLGGIYAGPADEKTENLITLGRKLGYVYQIRDDWLGIWGEPEEFGKPINSDLIEKKKSFPISYAMQEGQGPALKELEKLYLCDEKLTCEEAEKVRLILEEIGAKEKTQEYAEKYWNEAYQQIQRMEIDTESRSTLEKFGSFLLNRKK